jgi:hypothetical protein
MKDLRRSVFAMQQSLRMAALLKTSQPIGDGCVAMIAAIPALRRNDY